LEGLAVENFDILGPFGILNKHLLYFNSYGMHYQDKSGNLGSDATVNDVCRHSLRM
jgi:hypothetical protein